MKPNEAMCFYCGNIIDRMKTKKRDYCTDDCRKKYWKGIYKKLWKRGDRPVMPHDKPVNNQQMKGGIIKNECK